MSVNKDGERRWPVLVRGKSPETDTRKKRPITATSAKYFQFESPMFSLRKDMTSFREIGKT
jgi:hypothetical protein